MQAVKWIFGGKKQQAVQKSGRVGVYCTSDGIAMAYITEEQEIPLLKAQAYQQADSPSKKQVALSTFVKQQSLEGLECIYVLQNEEYTLSLVETPNAPPTEMQNAFKWLAQEAITTSIDKSVIDYFELPLRRARDSVKMSYISIMQRAVIPQVEAILNDSKLILTTINLPEFAIRNLADLQPSSKKGVILVSLTANGGKLIIYKAGMILLCRSIDFKAEGSQADIHPESPMLEQVALEIQRSIDYSSNIFRQTVANTIYLMPTLMNLEHVTPYLKSALGLEVEQFDLSTSTLKSEKPLTLLEQAQCLMAIGAAVKHVNVTLETEH